MSRRCTLLSNPRDGVQGDQAQCPFHTLHLTFLPHLHNCLFVTVLLFAFTSQLLSAASSIPAREKYLLFLSLLPLFSPSFLTSPFFSSLSTLTLALSSPCHRLLLELKMNALLPPRCFLCLSSRWTWSVPSQMFHAPRLPERLPLSTLAPARCSARCRLWTRTDVPTERELDASIRRLVTCLTGAFQPLSPASPSPILNLGKGARRCALRSFSA